MEEASESFHLTAIDDTKPIDLSQLTIKDLDSGEEYLVGVQEPSRSRLNRFLSRFSRDFRSSEQKGNPATLKNHNKTSRLKDLMSWRGKKKEKQELFTHDEETHEETPTFPTELMNNEEEEISPECFNEIDDNDDSSFPMLGVKISYLIRFLSLYHRNGELTGKTSADINEMIIKPLTSSRQCSMCDLLESIDDPDVDIATVYIIHAWNSPFVDVMKALFDHLNVESDAVVDGSSRKEFVIWFDLFSINQHQSPQNRLSSTGNSLTSNWYTNTLKKAIGFFQHSILILDSWKNSIPLTRTWCLWELYCTFQTNAIFKIAMSKSHYEDFRQQIIEHGDGNILQDMFGSIHSQDSEMTQKEEKEVLYEVITSSVGFSSLNEFLFVHLSEWFIHLVNKNVMIAETDNSDNKVNDIVPLSSEVKQIDIPSSLYGWIDFTAEEQYLEFTKDFFPTTKLDLVIPMPLEKPQILNKLPPGIIFLRPIFHEHSVSKGLNLTHDWMTVSREDLNEQDSVVLASYQWAQRPYNKWSLNGKEGIASNSVFNVLKFCWMQGLTVWIDCLSIPLSGHDLATAFSYMGHLYICFPVVSQLLWTTRGWAQYLRRGWIQQETLLSRLIIPKEDKQCCFALRHSDIFGQGDDQNHSFTEILAYHRKGTLGFDDNNEPYILITKLGSVSSDNLNKLLTSSPTDRNYLQGRLSQEYQQAIFEVEENRLTGIFGAFAALFDLSLSMQLLSAMFKNDKTPHYMFDSVAITHTSGIVSSTPIKLCTTAMGATVEFAKGNNREFNSFFQCVIYAYWSASNNAVTVVISRLFFTNESKLECRCTQRLFASTESDSSTFREKIVPLLYSLFNYLPTSDNYSRMKTPDPSCSIEELSTVRDHAEGAFVGPLGSLIECMEDNPVIKENISKDSELMYYQMTGKILSEAMGHEPTGGATHILLDSVTKEPTYMYVDLTSFIVGVNEDLLVTVV
jgi:hypothetical protein